MNQEWHSSKDFNKKIIDYHNKFARQPNVADAKAKLESLKVMISLQVTSSYLIFKLWFINRKKSGTKWMLRDYSNAWVSATREVHMREWRSSNLKLIVQSLIWTSSSEEENSWLQVHQKMVGMNYKWNKINLTICQYWIGLKFMEQYYQIGLCNCFMDHCQSVNSSEDIMWSWDITDLLCNWMCTINTLTICYGSKLIWLQLSIWKEPILMRDSLIVMLQNHPMMFVLKTCGTDRTRLMKRESWTMHQGRGRLSWELWKWVSYTF